MHWWWGHPAMDPLLWVQIAAAIIRLELCPRNGDVSFGGCLGTREQPRRLLDTKKAVEAASNPGVQVSKNGMIQELPPTKTPLYLMLDEYENSNKENPRNREPGCIYTIEYANSESSSLFFYKEEKRDSYVLSIEVRETVMYCQSRLHYCYKATVRRSNE
jgi:hypothetical protein